MNTNVQEGRMLARAVRRHLRRSLNFQSLEEVTPVSGLRVDVMAIGPKAEIWIVECKSSLADYRSDGKWQGYLDYCDQFFWAVNSRFPHEILPAGTGLILADRHEAEIIRFGDARRVAAARRRKLLLRFARTAAERHYLFSETSTWDKFRHGARAASG